MSISRQDGFEQAVHEEEDGIAETHRDEDGDNASIERAQAVFLYQDSCAAPGTEEGSEACPLGGGACFLGKQGAAAAVVDILVIFGIVVHLLKRADLVQGVGEGKCNGTA